MPTFVIVRKSDGKYAHESGLKNAFTVNLGKAYKFTSRAHATALLRPNEVVKEVG